MDVAYPHDHVFKFSLHNPVVAKQFLKEFIPVELIKNIDFSTLRICKESYIEPNLRKQAVDVLFKLQRQQQQVFIYILVEHQSSLDPLMPLRIKRYNYNILYDHLRKNRNSPLPYIHNIVFYNGLKPYKGPLSMAEMPSWADSSETFNAWLTAPIQLIETEQLSNTYLQKLDKAGLLMLAMKRSLHSHFGQFIADASQIIEALTPQDSDLISAILYYVLTQSNVTREEFMKMVKLHISPEKAKQMCMAPKNIFEEYFRDGYQEGEALGRQQGKEQGKELGKEWGIKLGIQHSAIAIAEKLLASGVAIEVIAKSTDLPVSTILELKQKLMAKGKSISS